MCLLQDNSGSIYSFSREVNLLLKSDNSAMKIFKLFYVIEYQGGWVIMKIIIHHSKIMGTCMEKY